MKRKKFYIGLIICCVIGFLINLCFYNFESLKEENLLAVNYSNDAKYDILFDANGGELKGLDNLEKLRDGVYGIISSMPLKPSDDVKYSKLGDKYIIYFSLDHKCSTRDLELDDTISIDGHKVYYACYEQTKYDKGGIRSVNEGAFVAGDSVGCGDSVRVTTCYKKKNGADFTEYCEYDQINGEKANGIVYRMRLSDSDVSCTNTNTYYAYFHATPGSENFSCGKTTDADLGICSSAAKAGEKAYTPSTDYLTFNGQKFIGWAADDDGENVNCSGKLVTGENVTLRSDVHYYACYEEAETCENTKEISNGKGSYKVKVCYETYNSMGEYLVKPKSDEFDDILTCADGYTLDKVSRSNIIETTCTQVGDCYRVYDLKCVGERPKISASMAIVDGNYGTIKFSVTSNSGIKGYYSSREYIKPTINTEWVNDSSGDYTLSATPGTIFLWAIGKDDQISYAAMTSVIDKINVDTTLKKLEVKTSNGESLTTSKYAYNENYYNEITSSDYVRLSNELANDSNIFASGFNPFDTAYKVKTSSSKIAVYATLTSKDAEYVDGYEPRTVDLDYGINTILIKIKNKKGKERTYTILATREDDRDSTNYLKSLSVSDGKLNFSQYTSDYVVSVGKNKKSVSINAELASLNASYVDGYGPRTIKLQNESTTAAIKVKSETGSVRAYVITFIKTGEETKDKTDALLSSLSLSKAYIAFDKNISDYNTTVDYEIDSINIYAIAENGGDSVSLYKMNNGVTEKINSKNISLNVGNNNITIIVSNKNGKTNTYTINILRKENGLEISSETALSTLDVNGYDIEFNPEKLDYVIKIKREKTLLITATPESNRADVYIRGNDNLTAFSIVKIKVVSEDGQFREYTIDIKKDTVNKTIELIAIISGVVIIICGIIIIRVKKRRKSINNYYA